MKQWVADNIGQKKDRFKLLKLVGVAELGKTAWARSLGKHIFFRGNVDWSQLKSIQNEEIQYIIFDDVNWDWIKDKKAILLGMGEATVTDKYRPKMNIIANVPCIFLCNPEQNPLMDFYWCSQCINVELLDPLY